MIIKERNAWNHYLLCNYYFLCYGHYHFYDIIAPIPQGTEENDRKENNDSYSLSSEILLYR